MMKNFWEEDPLIHTTPSIDGDQQQNNSAYRMNRTGHDSTRTSQKFIDSRYDN